MYWRWRPCRSGPTQDLAWGTTSSSMTTTSECQWLRETWLLRIGFLVTCGRSGGAAAAAAAVAALAAVPPPAPPLTLSRDAAEDEPRFSDCRASSSSGCSHLMICSKSGLHSRRTATSAATTVPT